MCFPRTQSISVNNKCSFFLFSETSWYPVYEIGNKLLESQWIASSEQTSIGSAPAAQAEGWMPAENDPDPWLQVDFLTMVTLSMIRTKDHSGGLTSFTIAYSNGSEFVNYTQDGQTTKVRIYKYLNATVTYRIPAGHPQKESHYYGVTRNFV